MYLVLWLEKNKKQNLLKIEAPLTQTEAEVGAVAKADQNRTFLRQALNNHALLWLVWVWVLGLLGW